MRVRALVLVPTLLAAAGGLASCSSSSGTTASSSIPVTATDTACEVGTTTFASGPRTFAVTNKGSDVTEVYVYFEDGKKIAGEVENIGAGTSRDLKIDDLGAGTYIVACKPGQKGDGIRTTVTVTGAPSSTAVQIADREVELTAKDNTFTGMAGFSAKVGETVEFKMRNTDATSLHEFEVVTPDGATLGEIAEIKPGETGEVLITFKAAGTYTYQCLIDGHDTHGMKGTFTVS
jgi:uncharacterized cupredoxin-like copper-binding protein